MRLLHMYDRKDYNDRMPVYEKFSVRAVIHKEGKLALSRSRRGECKLLGGGIDRGETRQEALIREVREESGLIVLPESITEIGEICERRRDIFDQEKVFVCHSYYYRCLVAEETTAPEMTESEKAKGFHLEWVTPEKMIRINESFMDLSWIMRDTEFVRSYFR